MPPASVDQYIGPTNTDYMKALVALQIAIEQYAVRASGAAGSGGRPDATAARAAKLVTGKWRSEFGLDQEAHLEAIVLKLLEDPITNAEALSAASRRRKRQGKGLLHRVQEADHRSIRSSRMRLKATMDDINLFFAPPKGRSGRSTSRN